MIFLAQFGINKKIFQRPQLASALLLVFEKLKIYSCLFIPNCTRNHVITYIKYQPYLTETGREQKAIGNFENIFCKANPKWVKKSNCKQYTFLAKNKGKNRKDTPFKHITDIKFSRKRQSNERKQTIHLPDGGCSTARVIKISNSSKLVRCQISHLFPE